MIDEQIDQRAALRLQLAAIAGNGPRDHRFEVRSKLPGGAGMRQLFVPIFEVDRAVRAIQNLSQTGETFIGAAPRIREAGTADAVDQVWCLWADLDGHDSMRRAARFRPLPSIVIRTGGDGCAHAWWPLSEPVDGTFAQRANRRLALALGADRNATDPARILRPAGTWSYKRDPRRPVVCSRLELAVFRVRDIVGGLPDDPAYAPPPAPADGARRSGWADRSGAAVGALSGLAAAVRRAPTGERNATLNWAAYRAGEHASAGRLDAADAGAELLAAALEVGLSEREAVRTITSGLEASR
jgi:hypothetical protein